MTLKEAFKEIESNDFAARLNMASDTRTFLRAAGHQVAVISLGGELNEENTRVEILFRIMSLSRQIVDPRYENPWDTALAVYLWLIRLKGNELARPMAKVVSQAPQCWWAEKISRHILSGDQFQNEVPTEQTVIEKELPMQTTHNAFSSGEIIFNPNYLSDVTDKMGLVSGISLNQEFATNFSNRLLFEGQKEFRVHSDCKNVELAA